MKINFFSLTIASLVAFCEAKKYQFNVVSINGEGSSLGVKFNDQVQPLPVTTFPLFSGSVEADNISQYKYVVLDASGNAIEEESIERTYSDETSKINEVYNRTNKDVTIPTLPQPFQPMFPMGTDKFKPLPKNVIYNIYAKCDPEAYASVTELPFFEGKHGKQNNIPVNCTLNIISPHTAYQSTGSLHLIGFGSRQFKKLSWGVKFDKKFMGRKSMKLRAMASDPTLIRETFATSLYKAVGVPIQEGSYARLYINDDTYGLYTLIDSFSKKWLQGYVHGDSKAKIGVSYKLYSDIPLYPDFHYISDNYVDYERFYVPDEYEEDEISKEDLPTQYAHVVEFIKRYHEWVNTPERPVDQLTQFFNVEAALRLMVIDTLTLAQDNFWLRLTNAALYYNPERQNFVLLPYDFDKVLTVASGDPMLNKDTYETDCHDWAFQNDELIDHYFTHALMDQPEIRKRYDVILSKASKELFTGTVVTDYINSLAELIREDVAWNFEKSTALDIPYDGTVNHFTVEQFEGNINETPVLYNKGTVDNDAPYGILQWVNLRSENCIKDTDGVDLSKNDNISDKLKVNVYEETTTDEPNTSSASMTISSFKYTIGFIMIIQCLFLAFNH